MLYEACIRLLLLLLLLHQAVTVITLVLCGKHNMRTGPTTVDSCAASALRTFPA